MSAQTSSPQEEKNPRTHPPLRLALN